MRWKRAPTAFKSPEAHRPETTTKPEQQAEATAVALYVTKKPHGRDVSCISKEDERGRKEEENAPKALELDAAAARATWSCVVVVGATVVVGAASVVVALVVGAATDETDEVPDRTLAAEEVALLAEAETVADDDDDEAEEASATRALAADLERERVIGSMPVSRFPPKAR